MLSPYLVKLDTFEMPDIPQVLRLNCLGDNFLLAVHQFYLIFHYCNQKSFAHKPVNFFRHILTVLLPYFQKLVMWE